MYYCIVEKSMFVKLPYYHYRVLSNALLVINSQSPIWMANPIFTKPQICILKFSFLHLAYIDTRRHSTKNNISNIYLKESLDLKMTICVRILHKLLKMHCII